MKDRMNRLVADSGMSYPEALDSETVEEDKALLAWLADGHFIFLGYRDYDLVQEGERRRFACGAGFRSWHYCVRQARPRFQKASPQITPEARNLARRSGTAGADQGEFARHGASAGIP